VDVRLAGIPKAIIKLKYKKKGNNLNKAIRVNLSCCLLMQLRMILMCLLPFWKVFPFKYFKLINKIRNTKLIAILFLQIHSITNYVYHHYIQNNKFYKCPCVNILSLTNLFYYTWINIHHYRVIDPSLLIWYILKVNY